MENDDSSLIESRQNTKYFNASEKHSGYAVITGATTPSLPPARESRMEQKHREIALMEKIGLWNFIINLVGSLIVLGILIFLWFLWLSNDENPLWRHLILSGNLQRTVTLSAVVARTIISFQASLCTAMIAACILEMSTGFGLLKSATLSIRRFNGGQPFMLLRGGIFKGDVWLLHVLLILLTFTTIASQFTSTGLVTDLGLAPVFGSPVPGQATYSTNYSRMELIQDYEPDYTRNMPPIYPTFAEYTEPSGDPLVDDDTGPTMRAILPISSPSIRETISNFSGVGTLLNSRVVCMKPTLKDVTLFNGAGETQMDHPYLRGSISIGGSEGSPLPPGLTFTNYTGVTGETAASPFNWVNFTCFLATARPDNVEWPISMCIAGNYYANPNITGGGSDGGGRLGIHGLRAASLTNDALLLDPLSYILVNYTGKLPNADGIQQSSDWNDITRNFTDNPAWTILQNEASFFPDLESVSMSYCFTNFAAFDSTISMSSPATRTEPVLKAPSTAGMALHSDEVLRQLGADGTSTSLPERGVLNLEFSDSWRAVQLGSDDSYHQALDGTYGFGMLQYTGLGVDGTTWAMCTNCGISDRNLDTNTTGISAALSSIFQTSLRTSRSPAKALQAIFTVLNIMQYYDRLQQFDLSGPISFTLIETTLQPVHHSGLIAVTIGLILHLLIVGTITVLFLKKTKLSLIGESWHTIAQLQSADVVPLLEKASLMRDDQVEEMMLGRGKRGEMMLVNEEGSRACVVRRDKWI